MELTVWPGDWGLPSVDQHCLACLAFCKFADVPVDVKKMTGLWKSASGQYPELMYGESTETDFRGILQLFQELGYHLDEDLSETEKGRCLAYSALIEDKLSPALMYVWWVDTKCFENFTRPLYASMFRFPLGIYVPAKMRSACLERIQSAYGDESTRESKILHSARECLTALSCALGDKTYFFGTKPSSFDALLFGYLAPLLKAPLPNTALQVHLKGCRNLVNFCDRVLAEYFPLTHKEKVELAEKEEESRKKLIAAGDYPHKNRNLIVGCLIVLTAMASYSLLSGLISVDYLQNKLYDKRRDR